MSFYTPPPSKGGQLRTLLFNLAVYTGAVTVNGMPWIAGIDYSESVDLSYTHDPKFCGYVAIQLKEASNKDSAKFLPIIEFSVLQTVGLLTAQLASLCGSELKSGGATLGEMAHVFAEAVGDIPAAQPLAQALLEANSFSTVFRVKKVLAFAVALASAMDPKFDILAPEMEILKPTAQTSSIPQTPVVNNLEIPQKISPELSGFLFGHDFFVAIQRGLKDGVYDDASPFAAATIRRREIHTEYNVTTDEHTYKEIDFDGLDEKETKTYRTQVLLG